MGARGEAMAKPAARKGQLTDGESRKVVWNLTRPNRSLLWRTRSTIHPHLMLSPALPATGAKPRGSKKGRTWCRSAANDQLTLVIKNELLGYSETQLDTAIGNQQASKEVEEVPTGPQSNVARDGDEGELWWRQPVGLYRPQP